MNAWSMLTVNFPIVADQRAAKAREDAHALKLLRARSAAVLKKARALAAKHGIEIEREDADAYWVRHPSFRHDEINDPLNGNHFCSDGHEVMEAVQVYVTHFTTQA